MNRDYLRIAAVYGAWLLATYIPPSAHAISSYLTSWLQMGCVE